MELERDEETHAFCIGCKKWSDPSVHSVSRHVMSKNAQLGSLSTSTAQQPTQPGAEEQPFL